MFLNPELLKSHGKLLRSQHELEVSTKQAIFVGSSVSDTIQTCIAMGNERATLKVKSEFKVPGKRWHWLKTCAALEKFSREKRPPRGYKPFVEACTDTGQKTEARKYIPKLTDPRERSEVKKHVESGMNILMGFRYVRLC